MTFGSHELSHGIRNGPRKRALNQKACVSGACKGTLQEPRYRPRRQAFQLRARFRGPFQVLGLKKSRASKSPMSPAAVM